MIFWAIDGLEFRGIKKKRFQGKKGGGDCRHTEDKERRIERDWGRRIPRDREDSFLHISFSNSFNVENLSVCNENHYELTFLSRVLSNLTAPLWINALIVVYLMSI